MDKNLKKTALALSAIAYGIGSIGDNYLYDGAKRQLTKAPLTNAQKAKRKAAKSAKKARRKNRR